MKKILLGIVILWVFAGCTSNGKIDFDLDRAHRLMLTHPDSSLNILLKVDPRQIESKRTKARYCLLYSQALDKNWIDIADDSLIKHAVEFYADHGNDSDKANAYYYDGIVRNNASDVEGAMESFVKAAIYAEKTEDPYLNGLIHSVMGNLYFGQYSFEEAEAMYSKAASAFSLAGSRKNLLIVTYSKGLAEVCLDRNQNALESFDEAINIAIELADTATLLDVVSSQGSLSAKLSSDPASLQSIKKRLFQAYERYNRGIIPLNQYPMIGNIYLKEHKIDSARVYFERYLDSKPQFTEANYGLFALLSSVETQSNNYRKAFEYERLFTFYSDSLNAARKDILIQNLEKKYKADYYQKSYKVLQTQRRYETVIFILIVFIGILITGISAFVFIRTIRIRNRQIAEYKRYAAEVQQHYSELQAEYLKVSDRVRDDSSQALLTILNNRIHSLKSILELASKYENNADAFYKVFKEYIRVVSGKDKELSEDVISMANLTCHGIIRHLEKVYPSLSQRELCYCGFVCLGFTPESIRLLFNHTNIYSIYTMRSKIRSKMGLKNGSKNLESYIIAIMKRIGK